MSSSLLSRSFLMVLVVETRLLRRIGSMMVLLEEYEPLAPMVSSCPSLEAPVGWPLPF
jgi:hypothetical protein